MSVFVDLRRHPNNYCWGQLCGMTAVSQPTSHTNPHPTSHKNALTLNSAIILLYLFCFFYYYCTLQYFPRVPEILIVKPTLSDKQIQTRGSCCKYSIGRYKTNRGEVWKSEGKTKMNINQKNQKPQQQQNVEDMQIRLINCNVEVQIDPMYPHPLQTIKRQLEEVLNNSNSCSSSSSSSNTNNMNLNIIEVNSQTGRPIQIHLSKLRSSTTTTEATDLQKACLRVRIVFDDDEDDEEEEEHSLYHSNGSSSSRHNDENMDNNVYSNIEEDEAEEHQQEKKARWQEKIRHPNLSSSSPSSSVCYRYVVHPYIMSDEEPNIEELAPSGNSSTSKGEEWVAACDNLELPHQSLEGFWENLIYDKQIKRRLINYAMSTMVFASRQVNQHVINWNRMLLLHGPPGTGKTSLCKALAQKLAIRMSTKYESCQLLEIHSHSLFSKWFSTSGKLINALFQMIRDMLVDDPTTFVIVLIDEVESLASSRGNASNGDPTDAMRAVNSLLTSLDKLRTFPNVLVLATTNLTNAVDTAFIDRIDLKLYIGMPILRARKQMLKTCLEELSRAGIIINDDDDGHRRNQQDKNDTLTMSKTNLVLLNTCAEKAEGLSGRSLRRLPLQTYAQCLSSSTMTTVQNGIHGVGGGVLSTTDFLVAMEKAIIQEQQSRIQMM